MSPAVGGKKYHKTMADEKIKGGPMEVIDKKEILVLLGPSDHLQEEMLHEAEVACAYV